jgi:Rhs element Vgr protein
MSAPRKIASSELPTFSILINGEEIPSTVNVLDISVFNEVNRICTASVAIADGEASSETFEHSSGDLFVPGNEIEIELGYAGENEPIFKGVIAKQKIVSKGNSTALILTCKHASFRLAHSEKFSVYQEMKDAEIMESIVGSYGISISAEDTDVTHLNMVQYKSTDWDFVVNRAEYNSQVVVADGAELKTFKPAVAGSAEIDLQFGATMLDFEAELDGRMQEEKLTGKGWDYSNQEAIEHESELADQTTTGNLNSPDLGSDLENNEEQSHYSSLNKQEEIEAVAMAEQQRRRLSKIRGVVTAKGVGTAKPGITIGLNGLGDRFNGNALVTGVSHSFKKGTWTTKMQLGLDPMSHLEKFKPQPKSAFTIPKSQGLEIGLVTQIESDPDGDYRMMVRFPTMQNETGIWARVAQLDAGEDRAVFFRPEIGDEVIVGFVNDDPRAPVVLGALHSGAKPSPIEPSDDNHEKGIVTRSGLKLIFNDDKSQIDIETPNGNSFKLSDDSGSVELADENGNTLKLTSDGISMESAGDISIKATGDVNIEGLNINVKASANFKAEGSAGAEVSASAVAVLKGSLVQIN